MLTMSAVVFRSATCLMNMVFSAENGCVRLFLICLSTLR